MASYDLHCEVRGSYLFAQVRGEADSFEISLGYWKEIATELRRSGLRRVLVVEELKAPSSAVDTFEVASRLAEIGFRGVSVAFVDMELDHLPDNLFGENVARNRGVNGRVFNNLALAQEWLEGLAQRDREQGRTPRVPAPRSEKDTGIF